MQVRRHVSGPRLNNRRPGTVTASRARPYKRIAVFQYHSKDVEIFLLQEANGLMPYCVGSVIA
jgi:hypothetical protein